MNRSAAVTSKPTLIPSSANAIAVHHDALPALVDAPSPPLALGVGGVVMGLVIVGLVALTPLITSVAGHADTAAAPTRIVPPPVAALVASVNIPSSPTPAQGNLPNPAHYLVSPNSQTNPSQVQVQAQTRSVTAATPPNPASATAGGNVSSDPTLRTMQIQVQDQAKIVEEQQVIIGLLMARQTGTPQPPSAAEQLSVPPGMPVIPTPGEPATAGANQVNNSDAPTDASGTPQSEYDSPAPSLSPLPWPGWRVFGMSANAVMLNDQAGDVRVVRRGDTFLGVRLLRVDPRTNVAYTSLGAVHGSTR